MLGQLAHVTRVIEQEQTIIHDQHAAIQDSLEFAQFLLAWITEE